MTEQHIRDGSARRIQNGRFRGFWNPVSRNRQDMRVEVDGSGRTDAGVHALGQTASVVLRGRAEEDFFTGRVNAVLPPEDIRILKAELVRNGFHARKSAVGKVYEYHIDTGSKADVFTRRYCLHYPCAPDLDAMRKTAEYLTGTHEFAAYTDKKDEKSTKRDNLCYNSQRTRRQGDNTV